ncbi:uncharacterized protein METZ01_LOCUS16217 [marine metagenome]|uniref:Methyltransferase domain-containing protein n=1 Tax=marine metagenome TaxID=408172 RepID=A0A381PD09_9ZZZZ
MIKDKIFLLDRDSIDPFVFDESVANVFSDMLRRSIPGYDASIRAISHLTKKCIRPNTLFYDLGCSLGAATLAMRHNIVAKNSKIIAVDNSKSMTSRCMEIVSKDNSDIPIQVITGDIRELNIKNASMIILNYTLQFLPIIDRSSMIKKIYKGMLSGGLFFLSEKIIYEDKKIDNLLNEMHHNFKRNNSYSDIEIKKKQIALENVLIPEYISTHKKRLHMAGFEHVVIYLKHLNFISFLAIK